jgi:hypothetical protein
MTEISASDLDGFRILFIKMGAPEKQAKVMASQLLKRAGQIAEERNISIIEAAQSLLKQVIQAQQDSVSGSDNDLKR